MVLCVSMLENSLLSKDCPPSDMMAGGIASVSSVVVEGLGVVTPPTDVDSIVVIPIPLKIIQTSMLHLEKKTSYWHDHQTSNHF